VHIHVYGSHYTMLRMLCCSKRAHTYLLLEDTNPRTPLTRKQYGSPTLQLLGDVHGPMINASHFVLFLHAPQHSVSFDVGIGGTMMPVDSASVPFVTLHPPHVNLVLSVAASERLSLKVDSSSLVSVASPACPLLL
jgi:hypothetical protein